MSMLYSQSMLYAVLYVWPQKISNKPKGLLNTAEPSKQLKGYQKAPTMSR